MWYLHQELARAQTEEEKREEYGDLLFALVNYGRLLGFDAEEALDAASQKIRTRLVKMDKILTISGRKMSDCTKTELLTGWKEAKN